MNGIKHLHTAIINTKPQPAVYPPHFNYRRIDGKRPPLRRQEGLMHQCDQLQDCPFFNDRMIEHPGMYVIYRSNYCLGGDHENCARHMVLKELGITRVPDDLYPQQTRKAKILIMMG